MSWNEGKVTFSAGEDLAAYRRVKIDTGGSQVPIDVVYADAGEAAIGVTCHAALDTYPVTIQLLNFPGTVQIEAAGAVTVGAAVYGANDGKISASSNGSSLGVVKAAVSGSGSIAEVVPYPFVSTTAATTSIADSGSFTSAATVEAALAEIYQNLITVQGFIPLSLMQWREVGTMAVANAAGNGGVLASDTTPILQPINGATDGCQKIVWAASNNDVIATTIALPPNLDDTADLILHTRIASGGTTDAVGFTVDTWFNEGDTKVSDTSETNQTATWAEKITTIAAADVPSGAQTITIALTPAAHTTDTCNLSAAWLEYKTKLLTS